MTEIGEQTTSAPREAYAVPPATTPHLRRPFERALCAVDGTRPSYAAVEQAARLVGPQGHLTLLAVTAPKGGGRFRSAALGSLRAGRVIEHASDVAERGGVPFTQVVDPDGPPSQVIAERAGDHDLLALGAPSHSAFGAFGGGVAVETLHTFTTPLLLARPSGGRLLTETIVVASDGWEGSDALVELAARLVEPGSERIVMVHAQGRESSAHPHRVLAQKALLERVCGDRALTVIEPSDACELIEHVVDAQSATLAVLGSRRVSGVEAFGSVSRRAVRTLGCSVLAIPPECLRGRPRG